MANRIYSVLRDKGLTRGSAVHLGKCHPMVKGGLLLIILPLSPLPDTSFIPIFLSNYILLRSSLKFIANFAKLLTCIILLNFYEKSMEFHPIMGPFLTQLSVVSGEVCLSPNLMREIWTTRSSHFISPSAISRKFSYFSKIWRFKNCHLLKSSLEGTPKKGEFLIICLVVIVVVFIGFALEGGINLWTPENPGHQPA